MNQAKRRRGRPRRQGSETVDVHLLVPVSTYDAYCRVALRTGLSVTKLMVQSVVGRHAKHTIQSGISVDGKIRKD